MEENQVAHAKAILLLKEDLDYKELVFRIGAFAPQVLLDAVDFDIGHHYKASYEQTIIEMHKEGTGKIAIIKWYRGETGCGLKEAKDFVDGVCNQYSLAFS